MKQIDCRKMCKCSEKTAPASAAGRIVVAGLSIARRNMPGASWPENARIVQKNRPFMIFAFFGAGSKPAIAPEASAQNATPWNHENAESFERFASRAKTSGRIKSPLRPPRNSATLLTAAGDRNQDRQVATSAKEIRKRGHGVHRGHRVARQTPIREPSAERGRLPFYSADSAKGDSPRRFSDRQ